LPDITATTPAGGDPKRSKARLIELKRTIDKPARTCRRFGIGSRARPMHADQPRLDVRAKAPCASSGTPQGLRP
jgi:hypothetical protein